MADDSATEEWRTVAEHPDYEVSSLGRVRSHKRRTPRLLAIGTDLSGYKRTHLDGRHWYVHQLVALVFMGPRPRGYEVAHINHLRDDNRFENLKYATRQENMREVRGKPRKTHCLRGHRLSGDNLYIVPSSGQRVCKKCRRHRMKKRNLNDCPYCGREMTLDVGESA